MKNVNALHPGVRAILALVSVLSVPGLIIANALGVAISASVAIAVASTAACALCLAFGQDVPKVKGRPRLRLPPSG